MPKVQYVSKVSKNNSPGRKITAETRSARYDMDLRLDACRPVQGACLLLGFPVVPPLLWTAGAGFTRREAPMLCVYNGERGAHPQSLTQLRGRIHRLVRPSPSPPYLELSQRDNRLTKVRQAAASSRGCGAVALVCDGRKCQVSKATGKLNVQGSNVCASNVAS